MIEPGAEFRVVYATESLGCVVSQDISVDCEAIRSCLTPNDLSIMIKVWQNGRAVARFHVPEPGDTTGRRGSQKMRQLLVIIDSVPEKGTGIATSVRMEIHFSLSSCSIQINFGAPEFLDFNVRELKASHECSAVFSTITFQPGGVLTGICC
jgi:hypothetical protein